MLNTFPQLLTYGFFAPTILRILVAFAFFSIAYLQASRRKEISETGFPFIGKPDPTLVLISALIVAATGFAILLGWHLQLAALVGLVICIKHAIFATKYPRAIPLCRGEYIQLTVILLTLLISGAGAFAMDLP